MLYRYLKISVYSIICSLRKEYINYERTNDIMVKLISKEISMNDTIRLTGLTERQLYRKKKAYIEDGIRSIPHKSRGKSYGKGYSKKFKDEIVRLYKEQYNGWNFYHFNDTLEDFHDIKVSDSFIYNPLTSNGIESPHKYKNKNKTTHSPRERKEFAGELIQVDTSKHQWFYGDDNYYYYLHGGIDDCTGKVTSCFFQKEETTFGYQMILKETIEVYGIPECLYTGYRTVFKSTKKELTLEEELEGKKYSFYQYARSYCHEYYFYYESMCKRTYRTFMENFSRSFIQRTQKEKYLYH